MDTWNPGRPLNRRPSYYDQVTALPEEQTSAREAVGRSPLRPPRRHTLSQATSISRLIAALEQLTAAQPRRQDLVNLDRRMQRFNLHQSRRELATALNSRPDLPVERLRTLGRFLATTARHRSTVGLGVILLGVFGDDDDRELLTTLGTVSGLSCYASYALATSQSRRDEALFAMARRADGWPRVDAVRLLHGTTDPAIRRWLIAEACTGDILDAYFALTAAQTGDLAGHLAPDTVDDPLLEGASRLLSAMTDPFGPDPNHLQRYAQAPAAVAAFVRHVHSRDHTLANLLHLQSLGRYLETNDAEAIAWPTGELDATRVSIAQYTTGDQAVRAVRAGLEHSALPTFQQAAWAAITMQIPVATCILARLERYPTDSWLWSILLDNCPETDITAVLDTAIRLLLTEPGTTPEAPEPSSTCAVESALDFIVSRLDNHPGLGWPLIDAALRGQHVRTRNMAVKALAAWPTALRTNLVTDALRAAEGAEPDPHTKRRMEQIIGRAEPTTDKTRRKRSP